MKGFSEKLKKLLKERSMTQGQLCEKIGVTQDGLKKMIDNDTMKVKTLEQICEVLDVQVSYFIELEIKPEGFWERMLNDMADEIKTLKMRAYRAEDQLNKLGIGNFKYVSGRQGVLGKAA